MDRSSRLLDVLAGLRSPSRTATLALTERLSATTHLVSSLEYLTTERERRRGGFNNWSVTRRNFPTRTKLARRALDAVSDPRVIRSLYVARALAAASLFLPAKPGRTKRRLAANALLSGSAAALYPRHHYGTDGSDQASFLVQTTATLARAGEKNPRLVDACLWYVALQSVLSYTASGWAKLAGPTWRNGDALAGVMRTQSYGDRATWELIRRHPYLSRLLGGGTLAMECLFPAVMSKRKSVAPLLLGTAAAFHLVNARVMGLGRFVWSFLSTHPSVLYATGDRDRAGKDGTGAARDDTLPVLCTGLAAVSLGLGAVAQNRRRRIVLAGRGDERRLTTASGNTLAYRLSGPSDDPAAPLLALESGLATTPEHWEWILGKLSTRFPTLTYGRAGYGPSVYAGRRPYRLDEAAEDLAELVEHVAADRPVVLVGHSLGGYLALRGAGRLGSRVRALALLDPSHPGELQRSPRQAEGERALTNSLALLPPSLSLGLGWLLERPEWVDHLPPQVRGLALANYRDPRLWDAARREWKAAVAEFGSFDGRLPDLDVPALVVTAGHTVFQDPVQKDLHDELAGLAPGSRRHLVEGAAHEQLLVDARHAHDVAELVVDFVDNNLEERSDAVGLAG